jgi:hypothetical protein
MKISHKNITTAKSPPLLHDLLKTPTILPFNSLFSESLIQNNYELLAR